MTILQTAKELLKKGIALNDPELITMANQLIASSSGESTKATKKAANAKPATDQSKQTPIPRQNLADQFKLAERQQEGSKRIPVTDRQRFNAWKDDGVESKEIVTPEAAITKRTREPVKKVKQQCQLCQNSEMVNPIHVRDFYICDNCLLNKKKGR